METYFPTIRTDRIDDAEAIMAASIEQRRKANTTRIDASTAMEHGEAMYQLGLAEGLARAAEILIQRLRESKE